MRVTISSGFFPLVWILLIAFALSSATVLAETGKKPDKQAARRGAKLYAVYCESCHGRRGVGEPPIPRFIRNPRYYSAPALNDSQHAWHHSDENLVKTILQGSSRSKSMPAWKGVLSNQDAHDVVAYMKSLWSPRAIECQGPKHMSCD